VLACVPRNGQRRDRVRRAIGPAPAGAAPSRAPAAPPAPTCRRAPQAGDRTFHRPAVDILRVALACELVGQQPLPLLDLTDSLVNTILGQQLCTWSVRTCPIQWAWAIACLRAGLPLRFGQDHDRSGLDVDPDAAGLDLAERDDVPRPDREVVDDSARGRLVQQLPPSWSSPGCRCGWRRRARAAAPQALDVLR
jgi:hypothetical protein